MTGLIAIDESGDLGPSGTEFFTIAAIITLRARYLKPAADAIPNKGYEVKWNGADYQERYKVIDTLSKLPFKIVYYTVNKNHPVGHRPIYGNALYDMMLTQVIRDSFDALPCKDANVFLDACPFITMERFRDIVFREAEMQGINPKKVHKVSSQQNKCIQLVDFVAGAVRAEAEFSNRMIEPLKNKVSVARRH